MPITKSKTVLLCCASLLALGSNDAMAENTSAADPHAKHREMLKSAGTGEETTADIDVRDNELITHNGELVRFATDVVSDRIVVIDFVYTTCTTVCPVLSAIFQQVQQGLDDRPDADVRMISVSVDPGRDTPKRLKEYSEKLHAGSDWIWLTGEKTAVDEVLVGLGAYTPDFEDHPSIVLVGDPQSGIWKRFFGFPGPKKILAAVDELSAARQVAHNQP